MRTANAEIVLETGGAMEVWASTIKMSRKTFRMQIDSIYSDKIGAPVRELASNAFDSHRRAKQSRPFYVHCPTMLEPTFFVRDFGTGMTQETMQNVYIVIGESDKEMTDDEVGKWGLGSKSPFAYTDQYTITCYDGATARHYGYGIDVDGVPKLFLMHVEPSDEATGVKIGFAVEAKDFDAFKKSIEQVAIAHDCGFESNIPLLPLGETAYSGENWSAYFDEKMPLGRQQRWYARQGCVLYPISGEHVKTLPTNLFNTRMTFIIDCPIGTVQPTPSRESIEYGEAVIDYLTARVEMVKAQIVDSISAAAVGITGVAEFFKKVEKLKPNFITHNFVHPVTGLTAPVVTASWPTVFFDVVSPGSTAGRWEFSTTSAIKLDEFKGDRVFLLDDITPLLDPSRDASQSRLSPSEIRRLSRFVRAYIERQGASRATVFINTGWTPEFCAAAFPNTAFASLTFAELREAVPTRIAPPEAVHRPAIKGMALAKAAGEQKPVFELVLNPDARVAWVSSEQYRRQSGPLFKLARRFEISGLYIAAPGEPQARLNDVGVLHLSKQIDACLADKGISFVDWYFVKEHLSQYQMAEYVGFLRRLLQVQPKAYAKLAKGVGEFSTIAGSLERVLRGSEEVGLSEEEKRALDSLLLDDKGKKVEPVLPDDLAAVLVARKSIERNSSVNPTCQFVREISSVKDPDNMKRAVDAILYLQKTIAPSEKFKF